MIIKNAMEEFYYHFENNLDSIPSNEIKDIVAKKKYNSGFYELCLQYSEIALNADKFIKENGQLGGCFKNEDFDNATSATCQYIRENNIKDTHRFLSSIKTIHYYAKKDNENRQSSGFIPADNNPINKFGVYYNLLNLPDSIWDEIASEITAKLSD